MHTLRIHTLAFCCFILFFSGKSIKKFFTLKLIQGNEEVVIKKSVKLKKAPFIFSFEFENTIGVHINASFDPETYKNAKSGKPINQLTGFAARGMAENERNKDRELMLSNTASSFWFYTDKVKNSFDDVSIINNKLVCKRSINQLYRTDIKESAKISDVTRTLYIVIICLDTNGGELQRQTFLIKWL